MRTLRAQYPLSLLCRVLEVSRSGYYAWCTRRPSKRTQEIARLEVAIQAAHVRTRQAYGPERLQAELRADGFPAGIGRIKRLRKKLGLRCTQVRRFTTTTDSAHHRRYDTREQARREITEYIEVFDNRQRRHSRLGNRSPVAFAQQWVRPQPAA